MKQNKTKQNWQICPLIPIQKCGCRLDKHNSELVSHWKAALIWWLVWTKTAGGNVGLLQPTQKLILSSDSSA